MTLRGDQRWIVLASRPTSDEAIGIAHYHRWKFPTVRVVQSNNGLFAIIAGPVQVHNVKDAKDALLKSGDVPKDLYFSLGGPFHTLVWQPIRERGRVIAKYDGGTSIVHRQNGIAVRLSRTQAPKSNEFMAIATGEIAGRQIFKTFITESTWDKESVGKRDYAELFAARLDPSTSAHQYVFTSYWGGAHCCTVTQILTQNGPSPAWIAINGKILDGGGYAIEDVDGDGIDELVSSDNEFNYLFGPYSSSNPPLRVDQLRGGRLWNVSWAPQFSGRQRQRLSFMEYTATLDPERWSDASFLAGWVAQSALVGRGDAAFTRALELYDRSPSASEWLPEECSTGQKVDNCPADQKRRLTFPVALARHLAKTGYGDFERLVPSWATPKPPPPPAPVPPQTFVARPPADPLPATPAPPSVPMPPAATTPKSFSGTAFYVSKLGHALTNAHVVTGCSDITLTTASGTQTARLVAKDDANDIALIQTSGAVAAFATLRSGVRLGEMVAAFGYPLSGMLSSSGNFTIGNITALSGLKDDTRYIQISAPVQPGNSGGPLVDGTGNVVGLVTAKLNALRVMLAGDGDIPQNVNFAIKSSTAQTFLESNGVEFDVGTRSPAVESDVLAERAKAISARVVCRS